MRRPLFIGSLFAIAACGGAADIVTPPKKPALDPGLTIRVRDLMDTTTAPGRAHWHVYAILTGPYTALNGVALQGAIDLNDVRLGHNVLCVGVGADSVGQRLITVLAVADTTTSSLTPDATADDIVNAWYAGNHTLPARWAALTFPPQDAWNSVQFQNGHGQTKGDPIKWGFDWTGPGTASFYERTDSDPLCSS
jgi:hypothetical protein